MANCNQATPDLTPEAMLELIKQCGASDPQIAWRIFASAFLMPPSVAKRTSIYFSKNASE